MQDGFAQGDQEDHGEEHSGDRLVRPANRHHDAHDERGDPDHRA